MTRYEQLIGADKTRARVRGLTLAHGLATACIETRDLTAAQQQLAAWAVLVAHQDAAALLSMQTAGDLDDVQPAGVAA